MVKVGLMLVSLVLFFLCLFFRGEDTAALGLTTVHRFVYY